MITKILSGISVYQLHLKQGGFPLVVVGAKITGK